MSEIIGINEIKQRSPFRSPYLMIDRAEISSDGKSARGVKSVSVNEPFFNGHFPKQAIMPGVLQVEAMTQLGLLASQTKEIYPFLKSASRVKFRKPVVPGDILEIEANIIEESDTELILQCQTKTEGEITCQANLVISLDMNVDDFAPKELLSVNSEIADYDLLMDTQDIKSIIPHRYPFLLIDKILSTDEGKTEANFIGIKNVSINEPHFRSTRHARPYLPNYMLMEIAAQMGCLYELKIPENKGKLGLFMSVDTADFNEPVFPGDQLIIKGEKKSFKSGFGKSKADIYVGDDIVATINFKFALRDS